jgi:hypothetical protein
MMNTTRSSEPPAKDWHDTAFDLTRGLAAYTGSPLIAGIANVIGKHPHADIGNAFNHKQVASKIWARQMLFEHLGPAYHHILVVGGWYGILSAMLFDDERFEIGRIVSSDIDPDVAVVAHALNRASSDRFEAITADMYEMDYASLGADLVINTSCEHIADLRAWLALLPGGTRVLLQSNDYFSEPTHISCVPDLDAFRAQAGLASEVFGGGLKTKNYTRFMLIGSV